MAYRQYTPLVLVGGGEPSRVLAPVSLSANKQSGGYDEAWLQDLIFKHPEAMPVAEIEAAYGPVIPVCRELDTRTAGLIDALFLNHLGMPTLVECKLWRNPEARREVVGQILDYARTLKKWTFSDLQREAAIARKEQGFDLVAHVRGQAGPAPFDEAIFVDSVTRNLQRGRILLLIVGDGIREGVEAIAEYLQGATSLQFTFGLVEVQAFQLSADNWIVQPRVLARTMVVNRSVVDVVAPGLQVSESADEPEQPLQGQLDERQKWMLGIWTELLDSLTLDDREQPKAKPLAGGNIFFALPTGGSMWITCYFASAKNEAGVFLGYDKTSPMAVEMIARLEGERAEIDAEFEKGGLQPTWTRRTDGKLEIKSCRHFPNIRDDAHRAEELKWFARTINAFVNVFRPRVQSAWSEISSADQAG